MKVKQSEIVDVFLDLGFKAADAWNKSRLTKKLGGLMEIPDFEDRKEAMKNKKCKELLAKLEKAAEKDEDITIENDAEEKKGGKEKDEKPAKKGKAKKEESDEDDEDESDEEEEEESDDEESDEEDDDEEEESDDEEEEESDDEEEEESEKKSKEKKPAKEGKEKKGAPKKAGKEGGPGIIGSIVEFLQAATEKEPLTKEAIVKKLKKRFPERDVDSMMKTVNVQVPGRIRNDKGLEVEKNDNGYWISGKTKKSK